MGENDQTQDMPPDMPIPEFTPLKKQPGRIGTTIGDYEVDAELGRGGMGVVYRARQKELNRLVALKMLTGHYGKEELDRFLAEAQTAAGLHHTNIVHIYEVGDFDGAPYFSMEFVEGGTLAERLKKNLPTPREAAELLMPVARALHFAHQHGVVHRDMKPHNILIDPDGVPKVADFGIAKRMDNDHSLTRTGAVIGTPTYMAPEQAKGTSRDVGPAADVYSLGAILYEMLTGRPPFLPEESDTPIAIRVISEDTPSPAWHRPEIPREIEIICMKCLQKDPRDRYTSAAAFAEDLRRYLDDEGILARPPSHIVKGIKWVRRNPWRFTISAALLIILTLAGMRLYQWDVFERARMEYAATLDYVNGAVEPTAKLNPADASRRAVTLRLTRRGRLGPITKVEVLNPRGHPAAIRRLMMDEVIPLYIEGLAGAQPNSEKSPESASLDLIYDGKTVKEIVGRDRDGSVNWRILYDRSVASTGASPTFRARFANLRGVDKLAKAAVMMEFERDAAGHDVRVTFFDSSGKPAMNGEGVYGYQLEWNGAGRLTRLTNLDRNGRPMPNRLGLTGCIVQRDENGRVTRYDVLDAVGQLALWNGIAAIATEYDAAGNAIRVRRLGIDNRMALSTPDGWVVQEMPRNEHGEMLARKYFRLNAAGEVLPLTEINYAYDENGHPAEVAVTGAEKWKTLLKHDANGNLTEERFFDGDGKPVFNRIGYAMRRISYQPGPRGLRTEDSYFDGEGVPTYCRAGYRRVVNDYDATGLLVRQAFEDHDPSQFKYFRFVSLTDYDLNGRMLHSINRFEDKEGRLVDAVQAKLAYQLEEASYDDEGRPAVTWQLGWSIEKHGAANWRMDTSYYNTGILRHRIWQACDEERKPLEKVANHDPARTEEDFDAVGKLERKLEADFDESMLGFRSRELTFLGGKLHNVVHRNGKGEVLKDIQVFVKEILPDAQKMAHSFKAGDELLTANGETMGSAYEWMISSNFAGGYVEIMRGGQRLKIEGFEPGNLGAMLEDRAAGVAWSADGKAP